MKNTKQASKANNANETKQANETKPNARANSIAVEYLALLATVKTLIGHYVAGTLTNNDAAQFPQLWVKLQAAKVTIGEMGAIIAERLKGQKEFTDSIHASVRAHVDTLCASFNEMAAMSDNNGNGHKVEGGISVNVNTLGAFGHTAIALLLEIEGGKIPTPEQRAKRDDARLTKKSLQYSLQTSGKFGQYFAQVGFAAIDNAGIVQGVANAIESACDFADTQFAYSENRTKRELARLAPTTGLSVENLTKYAAEFVSLARKGADCKAFVSDAEKLYKAQRNNVTAMLNSAKLESESAKRKTTRKPQAVAVTPSANVSA